MKKLFKIIVEGYFLMKYNEPMSQNRIRVLEWREQQLEEMLLHPDRFVNGEIDVELNAIRAKEAIKKIEHDRFMNSIRNFTSTK